MSFSFLTAYRRVFFCNTKKAEPNKRKKKLTLENKLIFTEFYYLEIAAAEEEIDFSVVNLFMVLNRLVHIVEVSMHAPFNSNLHHSLSELNFSCSS